MSYKKSITDILSDALSPVLRKISDLNSNLFGTETQILRIRKVAAGKQINTNRPLSVLGDYRYKYESHLIGNCSIVYPFNEIRLFEYRGNESLGENKKKIEATGIVMEDLLPIKMTLNFGNFGGTYEDDPILLQEGDLILDIFYDEFKNCIPIILEFKKFTGSMFGKNLTSKTAELSLVRGNIDKDLEEIIEKRIEEVKAREALNFLNNSLKEL